MMRSLTIVVALLGAVLTCTGAKKRPIDSLAAGAMNYEFTECGITHRFPDRKIDWNANPTYNGYREWPWQFARHIYLGRLAGYYADSHDERAAQTFVEIVTSFIDDTRPPEPQTSPYATLSWRTLDTGIRASVWAKAFPVFAKSPAVTPEFRRKFYASLQDHARRLLPLRTGYNWRLMELHGLLDMALAFPDAEGAAEWKAAAERELAQQLDIQMYPDGFQYELTTNYHGVLDDTYYQLCETYRGRGLEIPLGFTNGLDRAYEIYAKLRRPDGRLPPLNDGSCADSNWFLKRGLRLFPAREDFRWFATQGREGRAPAYLSTALPYSGAVVFRTSWAADAVWAYVDMSPFGYNHQHEDKLNFLLSAYGKHLVVEPGSFHYDTSDMRKYVVTTRAHNTIRIDGKEQNARKTYAWKPEMLHEKADLVFETTPTRDFARSSYVNGYGGGKAFDDTVRHTRSVEFVKDAPDGFPYFRITDELTASDGRPHAYEQFWHLETCELALEDAAFRADFGDGVTLTATFASANGRLVDLRGQKDPEYQGWMPRGSQATREHRPIPTPTLKGTFTGSAKIVAEFRPRRTAK